MYCCGLGSGGGIVHEGGVDVAESTEQLLGGGTDGNPRGVCREQRYRGHESRIRHGREEGS